MMESKTQETWDRYFLQLAKQISGMSKDPSAKIGAVIVNELKQVVGMGYNGFPRGIADTDERWNNREVKLQHVVHAEMNAILQAGEKARGATIYVYPSFSLPPICDNCCKHAIQAGIVGIVGYNADETNPRVNRWRASIAVSRGMWIEVGNFVRSYDE
jgi:dCMP deaminase